MAEEPAEPLEEIDTAENIEETTGAPQPDWSLLGLPCVRYWLKTFTGNRVPWILLDKKLNLLWRNLPYEETYPEINIGENLIAAFYRSFGEESISRIYRDLRNPVYGFSYIGKLTHRSASKPTVIANIAITPIFPPIPEDADEPIGFTCQFDDVTKETQEMLRNTFQSLLEASKLKDNDTGNHIERVNSYSGLLAETLHETGEFPEIDHDFIEDTRFLASMHDVGKIGTPDDILNKNGPLESWEWDIMKEHTKNGAYLLATYPKPIAREIAISHHEKWNGAGYPYGLSETMNSQNADLDMTEAITDMKLMEYTHKAALSTAGRILQPTLLDFLR